MVGIGGLIMHPAWMIIPDIGYVSLDRPPTIEWHQKAAKKLGVSLSDGAFEFEVVPIGSLNPMSGPFHMVKARFFRFLTWEEIGEPKPTYTFSYWHKPQYVDTWNVIKHGFFSTEPTTIQTVTTKETTPVSPSTSVPVHKPWLKFQNEYEKGKMKWKK